MNEELSKRGQTMTNEEIYAMLTEEQKTALQAIAAEPAEKIAETIKVLTPIMCEIGKRIKAAFGTVFEFCDRVYTYDKTVKSYPNRRVVWLAFYHKKERVRKKNYRRVLRWLERRLNE